MHFGGEEGTQKRYDYFAASKNLLEKCTKIHSPEEMYIPTTWGSLDHVPVASLLSLPPRKAPGRKVKATPKLDPIKLKDRDKRQEYQERLMYYHELFAKKDMSMGERARIYAAALYKEARDLFFETRSRQGSPT